MATLGELSLNLKADLSELQMGLLQAEAEANRSATLINRVFQKSLKVKVNDSELTKLNEHLDLKRRHLSDTIAHFNSNPIRPRVDLDELRVGLVQAEAEINRSDRMLQKLGRRSIKPVVDDSALTRLNQHLALKQRHLTETVQHFQNNPITPRTGVGDLDALERGITAIRQRASSPIILNASLAFSGQGQAYSIQIDQHALTRSLSSAIKESFKEIQKDGGLFQTAFSIVAAPFKALGNLASTILQPVKSVFTGFFEGIGNELAKHFVSGFSEDITAGLKSKGTKFEQYARPKAAKAVELLDFVAEGLNIPGKSKGAFNLARKNFDTFFDNLTDPRFYRDLEDSYVKYEQELVRQRKAKKPEDINTSEILNKSFESVYNSRFKETVDEDIARVLGAGLKVGAQPFRGRKRIQLGESARIAVESADVIGQQLFDVDPAQGRKAAQSSGIAFVMGGVQPAESLPGKPQLDSTYGLTSILSGILLNSYVQPVTNPYSNSLSELANGPLATIRKQLLPWLEKNKDTVKKYMPGADVDGMLSSVKVPHPLDRILQVNAQGYDQDAIKLATKALAAAQRFPDKRVTLFGGSGGGFSVEEAIGILNEIGRLYPHLKEAVSRIKGVGLGTPIAGLTKTADTNADKGEYLAKYKAYGGSLDKVLVSFFGESLMATQAASSKSDTQAKVKTVLNEPFRMPSGALHPDPLLSHIIDDPDWGYNHLVQRMVSGIPRGPRSPFFSPLTNFLSDGAIPTSKNAPQFPALQQPIPSVKALARAASTQMRYGKYAEDSSLFGPSFFGAEDTLQERQAKVLQNLFQVKVEKLIESYAKKNNRDCTTN